MIILYSSEKNKTKNTEPSVFKRYRETQLILHKKNMTEVLPRVNKELRILLPAFWERTSFECTC